MNISKNNSSKFLFFEGSGKYLLSMTLCLVISSALGASLPQLINKLTANYDNEAIYRQTLLIMTFVFLGTAINRAVYNLIINRYVVGMVQFVRTHCYSKWLSSVELQTSKENRNDRYPQGEVLARIMSDTESLRELVTSGTFGIIIDIFFVLASLVSFVSLNAIAGAYLAAIQFGAALILIWCSKYMRAVFLSVRNSRAKLYRVVADLIGGVRENYYNPAKQYTSKKSLVVFDEFLRKILSSNVWDASYYSFAESLFPVFLACAIFIIPNSGITQVALIFAIIDLIQRSINPIKDVSSKVANIQRAATGVGRIDEFLTDLEREKSSDIDAKRRKYDVDTMDIDIQKFTYPAKGKNSTPFTLEDINFSANQGDLIGIVGLSGSGKSTLLNIMAANIIPDEGRVYVQNHDGLKKEYNFDYIDDFNEYRELIGIVSQDSHIFSESVEFNITMGQPGFGDFDSFWNEVCTQISYISKWGIRPDTVLDQNEISLGQKQLISAIRSCYLKKPIVLFDEISSSLDSDLEEALRRMILFVQKQAVTIIVAHRVETILEAQQIIVMEGGRIVAKGTHGELKNTSPQYDQFVKELSN
ncbi:ATP-binding cassette domain-containing protein [Halobacteriovorax sp.]|uniref:ATP-binding cassette domain-containing protein n=1 Tax=Halobacteriovorax sp. TaxID=2020862 RepID=UPI003AF2B242